MWHEALRAGYFLSEFENGGDILRFCYKESLFLAGIRNRQEYSELFLICGGDRG